MHVLYILHVVHVNLTPIHVRLPGYTHMSRRFYMYILKLQNFGCAILVTDHQVNNLFDIVDRAYVLGEQSIIAEGTPKDILKSSKAIELYFGSSYKA